MKKSRMFGVIGIIFYASLYIGDLINSFGEFRPGFIIGWKIILGVIVATILPLVFGYMIGKNE